jgi:formate dehydrogenase major subunit
LKGVRNGARLFTVDPRRTSSAMWADGWLGLDVGTDIALSHTMAREIIHAGLVNHRFVDHATIGFAEYSAHVEPFTLAEGERITGVPAAMIREAAHAFARADRAMICWTLGITEHHVGVDNVLSLINLALLCGHVGRWGSGLNPLRGQNNVQGGGDMGAIPNKLPGFQDIERDAAARARFEAAWGCTIVPRYGWHLTEMFEGMQRGDLRTLYVIGENPAESEADVKHARKLLSGLDFLVVQDIFLTKTAELADVVLPSSASWCEGEGTVTNSERRVQRVRKALDPPGEARDDGWIISAIAERMGFGWGQPSAEEAWAELRSLSPMHRGMTYPRLEELGGIQWPCPDESHPGSTFLHARLWAEPLEGPPAPFSPVEHKPPYEALDAEYPIRLTTGRRLESYNTGAQTNRYRSPLHRGESLDVSPEDAESMLLEEGEIVRVSSRRGTVETPVHIDPSLRPGLMFMTFHFPDQVDTNLLTLDVTDPKSGTAEFKACAIRVDKLAVPDNQESELVAEPVAVAGD